MPAEFSQCFEAQRAAYWLTTRTVPRARSADKDLDALVRLIIGQTASAWSRPSPRLRQPHEFETLFAEYFVVLETIHRRA